MIGRPEITAPPARVLIVDDERHNRQLLEIMLGPEGYQVQSAASGEDALAMVARQPPDLILLDVMMPGMDGYQVASTLKGDLATRNIAIIMVTALDHRNARMLGLSAGAEDFLTKPLDRAELCVRVRNLLRLKAYGDYYGRYSQKLEGEVGLRTADLLDRTHTLEDQAVVLKAQAALLDLAQDAIVVQDLDGRILFWSHGAEVMYGCSSKDAIGQSSTALLRAEFTEPLAQILATVRNDGRWEGEAIHHTCDGTPLAVACRWALQRDADGAAFRILTISNDITERRRAAADLRAAKEAAETANRAKSEFLANMSHEIRTPMNGVIGMTDLVLDTDLTPEQREDLEIVKSSADALLTVINDILDFSKMEAGKFELDPADFNTRDAIGDTAHTMALRAHQKGLELIVDIGSAVPVLLKGDAGRSAADPGEPARQRHQVHQRGEVVLQVRPAATSASDVILDFSVTDTGVGIPLDRQKSVFEAFTQADGSVTRSYGGTGLGLTISSQLVQLMGGRIRVESQSDRGSTFHFTARFQLVTAPAPAAAADDVDLRDVAVLIVDDNATNRRVLEDMVIGWGMMPTLAGSGSAALAELHRARDSGRPFSLVLTDVQMPDADGFALADAIRRDPTIANARVVMLTSTGHAGDAARSRQFDVVAYLNKPVKRSTLHGAVVLALRSKVS